MITIANVAVEAPYTNRGNAHKEKIDQSKLNRPRMLDDPVGHIEIVIASAKPANAPDVPASKHLGISSDSLNRKSM